MNAIVTLLQGPDYDDGRPGSPDEFTTMASVAADGITRCLNYDEFVDSVLNTR